jgi:hypothetical protein
LANVDFDCPSLVIRPSREDSENMAIANGFGFDGAPHVDTLIEKLHVNRGHYRPSVPWRSCFEKTSRALLEQMRYE